MDPTPSSARFERLLNERAWVHRLARALVRDESTADDLEQDTWLNALQSEGVRHPRAWLATLLRRGTSRVRDAARRRAARESDAPTPDPPPDPSDIAARAEAVERVAREVRALEEPYRTAVYLRYFEDLPPPAIATRLGVPLETVRTRLRRALARLRDRMDDGTGGGRAAWVACLGPLAASPPGGRSLAPPPTASIGGAIVAKASIAAAAGVVVAAGVLVFAWFRPPTASSTPGEQAPESAGVASPVDARVASSGPPSPPAELQSGVGPAASTGTIGPRGEREAILELLGRLRGEPLLVVEVSRLLSEKDPDLVAEVLRERWRSIEAAIDRKRILEFSISKGSPRTLDLLDLQFRDLDPDVHATASGSLRAFAGINFQGDIAGYERWREQVAGKPMEDLLRGTTAYLAERVRTVAPLERQSFVTTLHLHLHLRSRRSDLSGTEVFLEEIAPWFEEPWAFRDTQHLYTVVAQLQPDEAYLRRTIVPVMDLDRPDAWLATFWLGQMKCRWAVDLLLDRLRAHVLDTNPPRSGADPVYVTAQALALIGDRRAVPAMIALLPEVGNAEDVALISPNLARLAGVKWRKELDAGWWRRWWDENRDRLASLEGSGSR